MRVLPILFNTEMVRAILDNRKTATRRVIKPQPEMQRFGDHEAMAFVPPAIVKGYEAVGVRHTEYLKSPYQIGDILYVREKFAGDGYDENGESYVYGTDVDECGRVVWGDINKGEWAPASDYHWRPSIHMPREAARIWLRVTDVRVERLQDISEEDAKKEGIKPRHFDGCSACGAGYPHYPECDYEHCGNYQNFYGDWRWIVPFAELWDSTINLKDFKKYGWGANPWVWVIAFERCEKPEEVNDG